MEMMEMLSEDGLNLLFFLTFDPVGTVSCRDNGL